ncbi:MAG: phosphatidylserine decarboxylase [Desulfobacteraceae bacterium]
MAGIAIILILAGLVVILGGAWAYWRYIWFFRNPARTPLPGDNLVSPADGTVVYVKQVQPGEEVMSIKQGVVVRLGDLVRQELAHPQLLIGIFMSPFDVHYNRIPLAGEVEFIRHYPAATENYAMRAMHWRTLCRRPPYYRGSWHILQNERTVTKINSFFKGKIIPQYIVQIAGKAVNGIDSYIAPGQQVDKGAVFGMIRIGSQVDLLVPYLEGMQILVAPGDKVRAGESILIS